MSERDTPGLTPAMRNVLVGIVFLLSIALRLVGLGQNPEPHATDDEFHYAWAGLFLLHTGTSTSWSSLETSSTTQLGSGVYGRSSLNFVTPALDHPPAFSLLLGGFAKATAAASPLNLKLEGGSKSQIALWDIDLTRARLLSVMLFACSFWLLYQLVLSVAGWGSASVAVLLYGCISHVVLHGRLLVPDNATTPLLLLNLLAVVRLQKGVWSERTFAIITFVALPLAMLCKLVAVSQVLAVALPLILLGRRRVELTLAGAVAFGLALYFLYGWWQGWTPFIGTLATQSRRFSGFDAPLVLFTQQRLVHALETNVPLLLGWVCLYALALRQAGTVWLAAFGYLLGFSFFTAASAIYGWHHLPFYPFLCAALAVTFTETYAEPIGHRSFILLALLLPSALQVIWVAHTTWLFQLRYVYLLVVGLAFLAFMWQTKWSPVFIRIALIASLATLLIHEAWKVLLPGA